MNKHILIIAELVRRKIHPVTFELIGKAGELAAQGGQVITLLLGETEAGAENELFACGSDVVYKCEHSCFERPLEELFSVNAVGFIREYRPGIVLIGATNFGRSLAPRIAAALKTGLTADCTQLQIDEDGGLVQIRPAFSGNILAHIVSERRPQMATIRYQEFAQPERDYKRRGEVRRIAPYVTAYEQNRIIRILEQTAPDITAAEVVVAAGRGLRRKDDLKMIAELAGLLGGQLAVSRALVDAGMADSSIQVGYSGHRVKPRVYIACGISGAPQHIAGMAEAEMVLAINSDATAPIFAHCTYGFVGDLYDVVPRLIRDLKSNREVSGT